MDFIDLVNSKDRDCESKKTISFSQRSPIETKKAIGVKDFDNLGHSFNINNGEVIESALFDRIKKTKEENISLFGKIKRSQQTDRV